MGSPKQMLWNIFCALGRPSTLEYYCLQGKCSCFHPIWLCRIQWFCSLFPISTENTLWVNLVQKIKIASLLQNLVRSNMQNSMAVFNFSAFDWNYPFWANLVQIIEIVRLSWNLVPRLIRIRRIQWHGLFNLF